jgi:hypothetical protein
MPGKRRVSPERFQANLKAFCERTSPSYVAHKIGLRPKTIYRWLAEGIGWPTHETQDAVLKLAEMMAVNDWHDLWYFDWADRQTNRQHHERLDELLADPQTRQGVIEFLTSGKAVPAPETHFDLLEKLLDEPSGLGAQVVERMNLDVDEVVVMMAYYLRDDMKKGIFTGDVKEWLHGQLERVEKSQADKAERQAKLFAEGRKKGHLRYTTAKDLDEFANEQAEAINREDLPEVTDDREPHSLYSPIFSYQDLDEIDQPELDLGDLEEDEQPEEMNDDMQDVQEVQEWPEVAALTLGQQQRLMNALCDRFGGGGSVNVIREFVAERLSEFKDRG